MPQFRQLYWRPLSGAPQGIPLGANPLGIQFKILLCQPWIRYPRRNLSRIDTQHALVSSTSMETSDVGPSGYTPRGKPHGSPIQNNVVSSLDSFPLLKSEYN